MYLVSELRFKLSAIRRIFLCLLAPSLVILFLLSQIPTAQAQIFPSPGEDPLVTRCMPRSPCLNATEDIKSWDESLRQKLLFQEKESSVRSAVVRLTESTPGIILLSVILISLVMFTWKPKTSFSIKIWVTRGLQLTLGLIAANEASDLLKLFFGRLKPHVTFYNPHVIPALSFPSNHAFNTTFLCVFLWLSIVRSPAFEARVKGAVLPLNAFLLLYALAIAWSRVAVGQHYPFDVLAGIFMGGVFAHSYAWILSKFWRFGPAKSSR